MRETWQVCKLCYVMRCFWEHRPLRLRDTTLVRVLELHLSAALNYHRIMITSQDYGDRHITVNTFVVGHELVSTRKSSCRRQTRATRKHAKHCSNSTCLQRCRWQYRSIFIRLAVVASEICEILRNSLKIQTYRVQGHPRSSIILVSIESAYMQLAIRPSHK